MTNEVRVRFAPSPTGYLHVGGARTAVYNWLYTKKTDGKFILRIEDTDAERSTDDSIKGILDGLEWLGLNWDEGPFYQSQFINEHIDAAKKMLESGHAYKCFCTKEELDAKREEATKNKSDMKYDGTCRNLTPEEVAEKEAAGIPYTVRLKVPGDGGSVKFKDEVHGFIEKKYEDIEDFIILRSNGQPLYVLSNAVDDIRDRITHIIRGQDGLANTPKQILIYKALGAPIPVFAHISLTLDTKKAKISKRKHGEQVAVHFYREHGFIPWAFVNFLVLLGWSTSESTQIFSKDELIEQFSLNGLNKSNSVFDIRKDDPKFFTDPKAISINAHYIKNMPVEELAPYVKLEFEKEGIWHNDYEGSKKEWFYETVKLLRERYHYTTDFTSLGRAFFSDDFEFEEKVVKKNLQKNDILKTLLPELADKFAAMDGFEEKEIEDIMRAMIEEQGIKAGVLINGVRTAVTGQAVGPGIFELLTTLGKERVIDRLKKVDQLYYS
ncbi:MAG: glutamate--tRNA ligase [Desulfobacteraceae bacterium]